MEPPLTIRFEQRGAVAWITLNRPDAMNALSETMCAELRDATERCERDPAIRVIVLTGALNPARFQGSDAVFNIGCAVGAVQCMPPGVWIAMSGRIWDASKVRKNRAANRFEAA